MVVRRVGLELWRTSEPRDPWRRELAALLFRKRSEQFLLVFAGDAGLWTEVSPAPSRSDTMRSGDDPYHLTAAPEGSPFIASAGRRCKEHWFFSCGKYCRNSACKRVLRFMGMLCEAYRFVRRRRESAGIAA